jgi:hypothetical protein
MSQIMWMKKCLNLLTLNSFFLASLSFLISNPIAQANEWIPVTGRDTLSNYMSGMEAQRALPNGNLSRGEYNPDGTGTLFAWGASISRTWTIKGDDQVCITAEQVVTCYQFERNSNNENLYRAREVVSGKMTEFQVVNGKTIASGAPGTIDDSGGAATASAAELAAELSNPNSSVATLTFKNQFRWFDGDLPDAGDQSNYTLLFQPGLPFVLDSGDKILWRPAIPLFVDQPVFDADTGGFGGETGLGDIAFDLAYAPKLSDSSIMFAYGVITSLPTATNDLGAGQWTLGPELLIGKLNPKWVLGLFPNHQWDVTGWTENTINITSIQAFYTYLPGGGWSVGTGPTITYDWESEQWTVPLQVNTGKTVVWNGRPWKLSVEANYYVEKADAFGPEWMISFNIAPVVKNGLASLFGLGE